MISSLSISLFTIIWWPIWKINSNSFSNKKTNPLKISSQFKNNSHKSLNPTKNTISNCRNSKRTSIKSEIRLISHQIKPDTYSILSNKCLNLCKNSKPHLLTKTKPNFSPIYTGSSTSKENSKMSFNPQIILILTNSKNKWSTEYSTQLKIKRKPFKISKNTKSISKKTWIFSKNITKIFTSASRLYFLARR